MKVHTFYIYFLFAHNVQPETNIPMVAGSKIIEASWLQSIEVSQTNILHTLNQYFSRNYMIFI